MITPEYLEGCTDNIARLYADLERQILVDIARKLNSYDYFVSSAEWQALKLQELGVNYDLILKTLSTASGKSKTELKRMLNEAGVKLFEDIDIKPTKTTIQALNAGLKKTMGSFDNLTRTTAVNGARQIVECMDMAYMQITSGAFSPEVATKAAVKELARNGLQTYKYPSHTDYLDVAVRRAARTGVNQTAAIISINNAEELGTDLVEVSAHSGARPSHAEWQGKIYSISGESEKYPSLREATGYGTVTGLCGANCRHTFYPYFEGTERAYTEKELSELNKPKYKYNNEILTEYEATQRQRYIERQIRRWKREQAAMKAAGMPTDEASAKVKHWNIIQADFLSQTGLKRQVGREEITKVNNLSTKVPKTVDIHEKSSKILLKDISINKSVGAKSMNYDVMDLETRELYHFTEGTRIQNVEVFAGKGTKKELKIAERYASKYGGEPEDWQHAKAIGYVDTPEGQMKVEVHWMQCEGIGRFDFFVKEWME